MDDFDQEDLDGLFRNLKTRIERRKSLETSYDDVAGTHESLDGEWGEWMCPHCGIFMKESRRCCLRCQAPRY